MGAMGRRKHAGEDAGEDPVGNAVENAVENAMARGVRAWTEGS